MTNYEQASKKFENELSKEFKKKHGIFYTDMKLTTDMISFLNIPQNATIIDPSCGVGNFLYTLKKKRYNNIYGCDFDINTVEKAKELTKLQNIFAMDTLFQNSNDILNQLQTDKFDYAIGNPPYASLTGETIQNIDVDFLNKVKQSGSNLFVAALYRLFDLVKENGIISVIIPKNLLHVSSYQQIRKQILKDKTILSIIELGIRFKTVRGEQIILTLKNKPQKDNKIKFYTYNNHEMIFMSEVRQNFYNDEIIVFTSNDEIPIYQKLKNNYQTLDKYCANKIARGRSKEKLLRGKEVRKFGFKSIDIPNEGNTIFIQNIFSAEAGITATYGGNWKPQETITVIPLKDKNMSKYILGLLHSRLCNYYLIKFIFNNSRLTIHTDAKYLNQIPIVVDDTQYNKIIHLVESLEIVDYLSDEWYNNYELLNKQVYKIYQLNDNEINYIENEMQHIFSKKWYKKDREEN